MKQKQYGYMAAVVAATLVMACGPKEKPVEAPPKVEKVLDVELFIMSKCPFGPQAVDAMVPAIEQFGGQVGLNIEYIGSRAADGTLTSRAGETEVKGNMAQICARHVDTNEDKAAYWKFLACVNKEWKSIPDNTDACVTEAGLDAAAMKACVEGEKGTELLAASYDNASAKMASGSPTIFINGERYMGGRSTQAIAQALCTQFGATKGLTYCKDIPPPPEVRLVVLTDKRCGENCNPDKMVESLKSVFTGLKPEVKDWSDPGTAELAQSANINRLPALLLDASAEKDEAGFKHMERWLTKVGDYYSIKIKADFDPTAEICDDGIDNTGNGKIDCDDETCKDSLVCRPETPKQLELFVMSQCPFGAMALNAMKEVLDAFKGDITFKLNYIGNVVGDTITSMKGPGEVDENIRWACANKHYPRNNDYLKFIWCRAADSRNPEWQKCATGPIKANVIEKCFNEEGQSMMKENLQIANALGVSACPTWIVNGRTQFSGITARAIQDNFCKANPGLKGCATPLSDDRQNAPAGGSCGG